MDFDFEAYKAQCLAIADAFQDLIITGSSQEQYEATLVANNLVPAHAVAKIEKEIIVKGSKFRPIDAYQF